MLVSFPATRRPSWPPAAAGFRIAQLGETKLGLGAWGRLLPTRPGHDGDAIGSSPTRQCNDGPSMRARTLLRRCRWGAKCLQRNRHAAPWSIATPHATGFFSPVIL